jgi:hypothetical protein
VLVSPRQVRPSLEQVQPPFSCTIIHQVLKPVVGQVVDRDPATWR